jgi:hypothetical protein
MSRRYRSLLLFLTFLSAIFMWRRTETTGRVNSDVKTRPDLLVLPNPVTIRRSDPLHRLSEMDFRLTTMDWEAAKTDLDVSKEFKDLGQRLRLFFEKWRKWESLSRWLSVEGVERVEGMGIGSTVVDEYRNVRLQVDGVADTFTVHWNV